MLSSRKLEEQHSAKMGSVCSEIPDLPEVVEGVVCRSEQVIEGELKAEGGVC